MNRLVAWGSIWLAAATLAADPSRVMLTLERSTGPLELAIDVSQPDGVSQGGVLFVHGYMSHGQDFPYTTQWFTARGWTVAALSLPGHGGSGGPRFDIDEFTTYGDAVVAWLDWSQKQEWGERRLVLAHSLGAASVLEALRRPGVVAPGPVVFCAPLLKTDWHAGLSFANQLVGWWLPGLAFPDYRARAHWFAALERWQAQLKKQNPVEGLQLSVYSGDKDGVVDEGWNRRELTRLIPGLRWQTLPGKDHWFLGNQGDREAFHDRLAADLGL